MQTWLSLRRRIWIESTVHWAFIWMLLVAAYKGYTLAGWMAGLFVLLRIARMVQLALTEDMDNPDFSSVQSRAADALRYLVAYWKTRDPSVVWDAHRNASDALSTTKATIERMKQTGEYDAFKRRKRIMSVLRIAIVCSCMAGVWFLLPMHV